MVLAKVRYIVLLVATYFADLEDHCMLLLLFQAAIFSNYVTGNFLLAGSV